MQKSTLTSRKRVNRGRGTTSVYRKRNNDRIDNLIVIGTSRGGHRALAEIFKDLSVDMPAAIVVILHQPLNRLPSFETILKRYCRLPIREVVDQERLQQGFVFVPPPGKSAEFTNGMVRVKHDIPKMRVSTINHMFESAAQHYGDRVVGVILTGLMKDGTEGLKAIHKMGGVTMVQDPQQAEYRDMPANAMEDVPVTFCLKLAEIGPALELLVRRSIQFETGLAVAVRTLRDRIALLVRMRAQSQRNPRTHAFLHGELDSLKRNLRALEHFVATQTQTQLLYCESGTHQRAAIAVHHPVKHATRYARPATLNHTPIHRSNVMDGAEADILAARTKELFESSEKLVRQSKDSIRELNDARRHSRDLMKKFRKRLCKTSRKEAT